MLPNPEYEDAVMENAVSRFHAAAITANPAIAKSKASSKTAASRRTITSSKNAKTRFVSIFFMIYKFEAGITCPAIRIFYLPFATLNRIRTTAIAAMIPTTVCTRVVVVASTPV